MNQDQKEKITEECIKEFQTFISEKTNFNIPYSEIANITADTITNEFSFEKGTGNVAANVLDIFEEFLDSKNITIQCSDEDEENDRLISESESENSVRLYGMEYWTLCERIESIFISHNPLLAF